MNSVSPQSLHLITIGSLCQGLDKMEMHPHIILSPLPSQAPSSSPTTPHLPWFGLTTDEFDEQREKDLGFCLKLGGELHEQVLMGVAVSWTILANT